MDDFNRIMSSYKDKLARMTNFFSVMATQCLELVKFDTHAPSAASFAPHIAASFHALNFTTTLVKKRVSEMSKSPQNHRFSTSTPSPHAKSSGSSRNNAINTPSGDNYNSHGISTRGSIGQSLHLGSSSARQFTNSVT